MRFLSLILSFFLLFLFCFTEIISLSAYEEELGDFLNIEASKDSASLSPPPPTFTINELSTFIPNLPKVNVITGEYCEEECDLVIAGIEPISYRRFYEHKGYKDQVYGHWRINPEALFLFNFEHFKTKKEKLFSSKTKKKYRPFAGVGEENEGVLLYEKYYENQCSLNPSKVKGFTNAARLSGQQHPLNTQIYYEKKKQVGKSYEKDKTWYDGVIVSGDGRKRFFSTTKDIYPNHKSSVHVNPPPYQGFLTEERKPNGNIIQYQYIDFHKEKGENQYYILKSITAYNSNKTKVLGSLDINYNRSNKEKHVQKIQVSGSDGREAILYHKVRTVQRKKKIREWGRRYTRPKIEDIVLAQVVAPSKPTQDYNYRWEKRKRYFDAPYMFYVGQPEESGIKTQYDIVPRIENANFPISNAEYTSPAKTVRAQYAPVGPNGAMHPIARYRYYNDHTIVYDGENHKTIYRFNKNKRITAVEKYEEEELAQVERSEWDPSTGNLISTQIEDGAGNFLHISEYTYDKNHNVIEEHIGDGQEKDIIYRTFSDDGFNLKVTESDKPGKCIHYTYVSNTNLPSSEIVYHHDRIVQRSFYFYDQEISSVCVKTIIDDGHSADPYDLTDVTYRKIIEIEPKRELPCIGLPQIMQEKTIDPFGNEILLKPLIAT